MDSFAIPLPRSRGETKPPQANHSGTQQPAAAQRDKASGATSPKRSAKPSPVNGFGLLFLLLAALPFGEGGTQVNPDPTCFNNRPNLATAANLRYCAAMMEEVSEAAESLVDAPVTLEDEETRRRRKIKEGRSPTHSDSASDVDSTQFSDEVLSDRSNNSPPLSSSSHLTPPIPDTSSFAGLSTATLLGRATGGFRIAEPTVLDHITSFLPLNSVNAMRCVSKACNASAQSLMPNALSGSIFIRFEPGDSNRGGRFKTTPSRNLFRWTCNYCNTANPVDASACKSCGNGSDNAQGIRKLFVGQLRKDRSVELLDFVLSSVFPDMDVFHIENHTNKHDGRSKGCAWVYVSNPIDEARVLSLNKRMFVDVDDDGREGIWFTSENTQEHFLNMAGSRSYRTNRPEVLPRQPLTAEKPTGKGKSRARAVPQTPKPNANTAAPPAESAQTMYEKLSTQTQNDSPKAGNSQQSRISVGYPPAWHTAVNEVHDSYGDYAAPAPSTFHHMPNANGFQHHGNTHYPIPSQHYNYNYDGYDYDYQPQHTVPHHQKFVSPNAWVYNPYGPSVLDQSNTTDYYSVQQ